MSKNEISEQELKDAQGLAGVIRAQTCIEDATYTLVPRLVDAHARGIREGREAAGEELAVALAERDALRELLPEINHARKDGVNGSSWWAVAILECRSKRKAEKDLASAAASLRRAVEALVYIARPDLGMPHVVFRQEAQARAREVLDGLGALGDVKGDK